MSEFMDKIMSSLKGQDDEGLLRVGDDQHSFEEKWVEHMPIESIRNFQNIDSGEDVSIGGSYTKFFKENPQHLNSFLGGKSGDFKDDFQGIMKTSFGLDANNWMDTNSEYEDYWNRYVDAPKQAEASGDRMVHGVDKALSGKYKNTDVRDLVKTVGNYTQDESTKNKFLEGIVDKEGSNREYNSLVKAGGY